MNIEGTYTFAGTPRTLVWEMFLDPTVLAAIMPGCKRLERISDNVFEGEMKMKVGPVQGVFQGNVALSELLAPETCHLKVNGKGPSGIIDGSGDMRLEQTDEGTIMHYAGVAQVSGRIASVGQRLMDSSAKAITRQSLQNLDAQIQARLQPQPTVEAVIAQTPVAAVPYAGKDVAAPLPRPPAPLPAPSQTDFALGVAREMVSDLLPENKNLQLVMGILSLFGAYFLLNVLANWWVRKLARQVVAEINRQK